jgi:hypothetical protein
MNLPFLSRLRGLAPAALGVGLALGGCSSLDVPLAHNYPASGQQKARAIHHWDVLAEDVARRIVAKVQLNALDANAFFLQPPDDSPFHQAFGDLLLTRLVNQGVPMASRAVTESDAPTRIRFHVQVVQHASSGVNWAAMPTTRLMAGVAVVRDWTLHTPTNAAGIAAALSIGALNDLSTLSLSGTAAGGPTRTEVLVTTSVERERRYVARTSDIYYIEQEDAPLYTAVPRPEPLPPAPVKNWKVVGP